MAVTSKMKPFYHIMRLRTAAGYIYQITDKNGKAKVFGTSRADQYAYLRHLDEVRSAGLSSR